MIDIDYMIKNDAKGYFGAFSKTGKNSAEILSNVRQKDRLLNPQKYRGNNVSIINFLKRNGYHNIYGDDEVVKIIKDEDLDDSQIEEVEEEIDIFKLVKKGKKEIEKNKEIQRKSNEEKEKNDILIDNNELLFDEIKDKNEEKIIKIKCKELKKNILNEQNIYIKLENSIFMNVWTF